MIVHRLLPGVFLCLLVLTPVSWGQNAALPGDVNGDGEINALDFFLYALNFDPAGRDPFPAADGNSDFRIDDQDLHLAVRARLRRLPPPTPVPSEEAGVLEGQVLEDTGDATGVVPIPGAVVWVGNEQGFRVRVESGPDGTFRVEGVPEGSVVAWARHPDYHDRFRILEVRPGQVSRTTILLPPKREDLADLKGFVRGLVDLEGDDEIPLVGATVRVIPVVAGDIPPELDPGHLPGVSDPDQVTFTDERGRYEFNDLPLGRYLIIVFAPGYRSERRQIVIDTTEDHFEDFVLDPVQIPVGQVTGTVYGVPSDAGSGIPVKIGKGEGEPLAGVRIFLEPIGDGIPEPGPIPFKHSQDPGSGGIVFPDHPPFYETVTDESGEYSFEDVLPGRYRIQAWAPGYHPADDEIEVVTDEITEQNFYLQEMVFEEGNLAGTVLGVTPDDTGFPVPIENAVVGLVPLGFMFQPEKIVPGEIPSPAHIRSVTTDAEGHYFISGVPVGPYLVVARARGWGAATSEVEVLPDATITADLYITHQPPLETGALAGQVLSASPSGSVVEPIEGALVLAFPSDPGMVDFPPPMLMKQGSGDPEFPGMFPPDIPHFQAETDANGEYEISEMPPGVYRVLVLAEGFEPADAPVTLFPGETTVRNFELVPFDDRPSVILGRVFTVGPEGEPVPVEGAHVKLTMIDYPPISFPFKMEGPEIPPSLLYEAWTDENGHFEFSRVPPGYYVLRVRAEGFRPERLELDVPPGEQIPVEVFLVPEADPERGELEGHVWSGLPEPEFFKVGTPGDPPIPPQPIPGALVVAIPVGMVPIRDLPFPDLKDGLEDLPGFVLVTRTDSEGFYRFDEIHAGPTIVVVMAEGYRPAFQDVGIEPGHLSVLDFWLVPMGGPGVSGLSGHIYRFTEPGISPVPVPGSLVTLRWAGIPGPGDPVMPSHPKEGDMMTDALVTTADEEGYYEFPDLMPGAYKMGVQAEGFVSVTGLDVYIPPQGRIVRDVFLFPEVEGEGRLFGKVLEHGDPSGKPNSGAEIPIEGALVRLIPGESVVPAVFPPPSAGFDRITDENGDYDFETLPAGLYRGYILKEGYAPAVEDVFVPDATEIRRDWFLTPDRVRFAAVEGTVIEASGEKPVGGARIAGATVTLVGPDGNPISVRTTDRGEFRFGSVVPGPYTISAEAVGYLPVSRRGFVEPGEVVQEIIELVREATGPGVIRGEVFEDTGFLDIWIPIPGAEVRLFNTPDPSAGPFRTTITDDDGGYVFEDLPPGTYGILVEAEGYHPEDRLVVLHSGQEIFEPFALHPTGAAEIGGVEGTILVELPDGRTVPGVALPVVLAPPDMPGHGGPGEGGMGGDPMDLPHTFTDGDGYYRFEDVPAGEVTVIVGSPFGELARARVVVREGEIAVQNFVVNTAGVVPTGP